MKKIAKIGKKVKNQVYELMENVSRVIGIDIGKEKLSCALMDINKILFCRFDVEGSLTGYDELLDRVKRETNSNRCRDSRSSYRGSFYYGF